MKHIQKLGGYCEFFFLFIFLNKARNQSSLELQ